MSDEIRRPDVLMANEAARRIVATLEQRGLSPAFAGHYLTRYAGIALLISELETTKVGKLENYTDAGLIHQISTSLGGKKVYISNTTGLRYVVPLSQPRGLPKRIDYPASVELGKCALGVNYLGNPVAVRWNDLGHLLVAGMTGSGKSMFLRLLAYQAIRDGLNLLVADIDQATFPMLKSHPSLAAPLAEDASGAFALIRRALDECDRRAALYKATPGYPETLEEYNKLAVQRGGTPLPRLLLILDEFSATLSTLGGGKGNAAQLLAAIGFRGRKFGISVVFAAHEFTKEHVGLLRDQVRTVVMFRVQSREMARRVNCDGAERISASRPGLAMTNRWGPMQTYFLDKSELGDNNIQLTPIEDEIFRRALQQGGLITRNQIIEWTNASEWQTRKWVEAWAMRGWIAKDPRRNNAYAVTNQFQEMTQRHLPEENHTQQEKKA